MIQLSDRSFQVSLRWDMRNPWWSRLWLKWRLPFGAALALGLLGGCPLPIGFTPEREEDTFKWQELDSLVGSRVTDIYEKLGIPHEAYTDEESTYTVYRLSGETFVVAMLYLPIWAEQQHAVTCYALEFGPDRILRHIDSAFYFHPHRRHLPSCRHLLWGSSEEMKRKGIEPNQKVIAEIAWESTCLSAHKSLPAAQAHMAKYYQYGNEPMRQDLLQAYIWFRLAEMNGFEEKSYRYFRTDSSYSHESKPFSERIADDMTPDRIAEAERLVAEWEPNPAECEEIVGQADN